MPSSSKSSSSSKDKEKPKKKSNSSNSNGTASKSKSKATSPSKQKQATLSFEPANGSSGNGNGGSRQGGRSLSSLGSMFSSRASQSQSKSQTTPTPPPPSSSMSNRITSSSSSLIAPRSAGASSSSSIASSSYNLTSSQEKMPPPPPPIPLSKPNSNHSISMKVPESQIWSEKYIPSLRSDLAIHPRKVSDVEKWLKESFEAPLPVRKYRRLLVLTGPAGSGKTSVIKALSGEEELGFEILEWNEEAMMGSGKAGSFASDFKSEGSDEVGTESWKGKERDTGDWRGAGPSSGSIISRFDDFINSAAKYSPLSLSSTSISTPASSSNSRRVILLEDLPNLSHPSTYASFQSILLQYLQSSTSTTNADLLPPPIILIISTSLPKFDDESWITEGAAGGGGGGNGGAANWIERKKSTRDVRNVLDQNIRDHPTFAEIMFNSIAETYLKKGLKRVMDSEFSKSSTKGNKKNQNLGSKAQAPPKEAIDALAKDSSGDIRSAINCLQFLVGMKLKSDQGSKSSLVGGGKKRSRNGDFKAETQVKGKGKGKGKAAGTNEELKKQYSGLLKVISRRESSLALFHLVGKILYNKRYGDTEESDDEEQEETSEEEDSLSEWSEEEETKHSQTESETEDEDEMEVDDEEDNFSWSDDDEDELPKGGKSKNSKSKSKAKPKSKLKSKKEVKKSTIKNKTFPNEKSSKSPSKMTSEEKRRLRKRRERKEDRRDLRKWKALSTGSDSMGNFDWKGLPDHLSEFQRRKSRVNVNNLYLSSPVDHSMLQLYLHQNFVPFLTEVDQGAEILEGLSFADSQIGGKTGQEYQHQNLISQYSFLITVHQTLLSLPSPVPRRGRRQQFYKSSFFDAYKRGRERIEKLEEVRGKLQAGGNLDELVYAQSKLGIGSSSSAGSGGLGGKFGSMASSSKSNSSRGFGSARDQLNQFGSKPLSQKEMDRLELIGLSLGNRLSNEDLACDLLPALTKINAARKNNGEAPVISLPASLSNLGTMPKDLGLAHAEALGENEVDMEVEDEKRGLEEGREDEKAIGTKDEELRESGWENEVNQKEEEEEELLYLLEDDVEEWDE